MHALVTALGVLLVLFGFFGDGWPFEAGDAQGVERGEAGPTDPAPGGGAPLVGPSAARSALAAPAAPAADATGDVPVQVRVVHADGGAPAPGATVELWRAASGQGVAYRPHRRLTRPGEIELDPEGRATLAVPRGSPLELVAYLGPRAPRTTVPLGVVDAPLDREILVPVRRRPPELEVLVRGPGGEPEPGATLRLVTSGDQGRAEFPGGAPMARTDGDGRATLPGEARGAAFLVVSSAGAAAHAVPLEGIGREQGLEVRLEAPGTLEVRLGLPRGVDPDGLSVEVDFDLDGYRARRTVLVSRRGEARVDGLPPGVPLRLRAVGPREGVTEAPPLRLAAGETRGVALAHFPR